MGSEYFAQRFIRAVNENGQTNFWPFFWPPKSLFFKLVFVGWELRGENGKPIIAGYPLLPHRRLRPGVRTVCAISPPRDMYITLDC